MRAAFVSTNSITQGEQVGALWGWLLAQGVKIHFAHRTFSWSNEARGKAAVHCVIIGFYLPSPASGRGAGGEGVKGASLADLYDPLTMSPDLVKAHQKLDAAVDAAYGYKGAATDAARVAFLFERYRRIIQDEKEKS